MVFTVQVFGAEPGEERKPAPPADSIAPYDRNGDGKLDLAERAIILEIQRRKIAPFDVDGDGHLNAGERGAARQAWLERLAETPRTNALAVAAILFNQADINGDGKWDRDELASFREALIRHREETDKVDSATKD